MVDIRLDVRGMTRFRRELKLLEKRFPLAVSKGMLRFGKRLEKAVKLKLRKHTWTGRLAESVEYRQRRRGKVGNLFILRYGLALDHQPPHWAPIRPGTKLRKWAISHGVNYDRTKKRFAVKAVYVRPHPFIEDAFRRTMPKMDSYIETEIDKELRRIMK